MNPDLLPADLAADPPFPDELLDAAFDSYARDAAEDGIDFTAALAFYRDADLDDPQAVTMRVARWQCTDDHQAEWLGRKLAMARAEARQLAELRDEWVRQITDWYTRTSAPHMRTAAWAEGCLADYALRRRDAGGSATLALPSVTVKTSSVQPASQIDDDEALATYIEACLDDPERAEAWSTALEAAGLEPRDLVARTAKVYVRQLRQVAYIGQRGAGWEATALLACSHHLVDVYPTMDTTDAPVKGQVVACPTCNEPAAVTLVTFRELHEPAVLGPDHQPLPATHVTDAGINVTVVAK